MQQLGARDFIYALAAHALLFGLLAVSVHFGSVTDQAAPGTEKAVQAVAVEDIPTRDEPDNTAEEEAKAQAQAEAEAAEQARREAEAAEQAQREAEAAERARREAAEQAEREAAEQARLQAEAQAQREAQAERARREAEAAEQARREAEAAEQARREAEAAEQARREAEAAEQARREAAQLAERVAKARGTFDGAIRQKIERAWNRPASVPSGLSCIVAVRLGPGGSVLSAQVVQSSGNTAFDQSAERAVFRADPLPMPDEAALAAPYRQGVELVFNPDE